MKTFRTFISIGVLLTLSLLAGCEFDLDACLTIDLNGEILTGLPVFDKCLVGSEF